jgi:AcrR family transcriptional regulator
MAETTNERELGVREQRKRQTREELLQAASELFADRGYDNVTVAEIAAGAGVSVKTLFQHFRSKEELLLSELDETHERLVSALRQRNHDRSPLEAVTEYLLSEADHDPPDSLERFLRTVGHSQPVAALRRRLYEDWENAIVQVLADEANEARPTPRTRLIAAQLVCMIRVHSSPEVTEFINRHPVAERPAVYREWLQQAVDLIGHGLLHEDSRALG